jgi:hypothetical protein
MHTRARCRCVTRACTDGMAERVQRCRTVETNDRDATYRDRVSDRATGSAEGGGSEEELRVPQSRHVSACTCVREIFSRRRLALGDGPITSHSMNFCEPTIVEQPLVWFICTQCDSTRATRECATAEEVMASIARAKGHFDHARTRLHVEVAISVPASSPLTCAYASSLRTSALERAVTDEEVAEECGSNPGRFARHQCAAPRYTTPQASALLHACSCEQLSSPPASRSVMVLLGCE